MRKEDLENVENFITLIKGIPEQRRGIIVMMANAFVSGMESIAEITEFANNDNLKVF